MKNEPTVTKPMLDDAVTDIANIISDFSNRVDERFNKIEEDIAQLNKKYEHLINTLDAFLKRLDDIEADNTARDAQLARIDRWVHQVADKLQIELS
jgi:isoleucyl-tRNA synthetase